MSLVIHTERVSTGGTHARIQAAPVATDFYLGRQPILDRRQSPVAYELLFRPTASNAAAILDDRAATAAVLLNLIELGLETVIGSADGYINVDAGMLMSDVLEVLPREKVVLEILETVEATPELLARLSQLKQDGYRFALDDVTSISDNLLCLLPFAELIKVDVLCLTSQQLSALCATLLPLGLPLLAEKVETHAQFHACLELGFTYFQGYHFAKPKLIQGKKLGASELSILNLIGKLNADAPDIVVAATVKRDTSLSVMLLRLVNSPAAGLGRRVESIGQALTILGRRQLLRWLQVALYAKPAASGADAPQLLLAATRGKLMELLAEKVAPGQKGLPDTAFTIGILSLLEALLGHSLASILDQLALPHVVRLALLERQGVLGRMLQVVEALENTPPGSTDLVQSLAELGVEPGDLARIELAAFQWSNSLSPDHE